MTTVELDGKDGVLRVLTLLSESGLPWSDVETAHDTLEEVFVRLVGRMDEGKIAEAPPQSLAGASR